MSKLYLEKLKRDKNVNIETLTDVVQEIYKPKKVEALRISELYASVLGFNSNYVINRAFNMAHCGDWLEFMSPLDKDSGNVIENKSKLYRANFCKDRFCPLCQYRLSVRHFVNISKVVELMSDCGMRFLFVTLTIPNCKGNELNDTIAFLNKGWNKFYRNKRVKSSWLGYYKALEVTYNKKTKSYHPHLHLLVCVKSNYFNHIGDNDLYLSHSDIKSIWAKCNNDLLLEYNNSHETQIDGFLCNVKAVKETRNSIKEVAKYCTKSEFISEETLKDLFYQLKNVRFCEYIGLFRKFYNDLKLNENLSDNVSEEIDYLVTHWNYLIDYGYVLSDKHPPFLRKGGNNNV